MKNLSEISVDFWFTVSYTCIAFVLYYLFVFSMKKRTGKIADNTANVLLNRSAGVLLFGIIPFLFLYSTHKDVSNFGLNFENPMKSMYIVLILLPVIVLVTYFNAKKEQNMKMYPEIRKQSWSIRLLLLSGFSWLAYIFAYEFLFRGFILFMSLESFSYLPAVIINIILYAGAHLPKGMKETLASIPFGIALCLITIETGNMLASFALHGSLALLNEWFSLKAHSEMHLCK